VLRASFRFLRTCTITSICAILKKTQQYWNGKNGRQAMPLGRLRPGFQFARLMTYDELCDFVNMGVRKDGADAFRVKRRRRIQVQGGTIPTSVTFYCNHGRAHGDEAGRESKRTPDASSNSRAQEARHIIYSGCSGSFVVTRMQAHLWWACSGQMQGRLLT
jgi:hypothetical protein